MTHLAKVHAAIKHLVAAEFAAETPETVRQAIQSALSVHDPVNQLRQCAAHLMLNDDPIAQALLKIIIDALEDPGLIDRLRKDKAN